MNLWIVFLTGLTTGGLSCLAMQGGLLASVIANQKDQEHDMLTDDPGTMSKAKRKNKRLQTFARANFSLKSFDVLDWLPVGMFLITKLVAHTILGALLGLLGSTLTLSVEVRLVFQIFTAFFMLATAMNLLNVHPIFRYVVFQPPKFIQKMIRNSAKSNALFAPAVLGFMTIFIPCGVTQAMEVLAVNSGSPLVGALIMFSFVLGTSPLFAILGVATAKLSEGWYQKFSRFAAVSLILMALYGLNGVLVVLDSPLSLNKMVQPLYSAVAKNNKEKASPGVNTVNGVQMVSIAVLNNGYSPRYVKVKAGMPVELTLRSNETYSCALSFILREFGIKTFLAATDTQTFRFTPKKPGTYPFTCSMGMYSGTLEVI